MRLGRQLDNWSWLNKSLLVLYFLISVLSADLAGTVNIPLPVGPPFEGIVSV